MSTEAMAVVVGVVCGVAAAIPMSLLIVVVSSRRDRQAKDGGACGHRVRGWSAYPPVIVVQGGSPMGTAMQPPYLGSTVGPAPRQFHIVGEDWISPPVTPHSSPPLERDRPARECQPI